MKMEETEAKYSHYVISGTKERWQMRNNYEKRIAQWEYEVQDCRAAVRALKEWIRERG